MGRLHFWIVKILGKLKFWGGKYFVEEKISGRLKSWGGRKFEGGRLFKR